MLNQADYLTWIDEGNGKFCRGECGVCMRVEGNTFDVALPSGHHERGTAASPGEAKQAAFMKFVAFAIRQLVDHKVNLPTHPAS